MIVVATTGDNRFAACRLGQQQQSTAVAAGTCVSPAGSEAARTGVFRAPLTTAQVPGPGVTLLTGSRSQQSPPATAVDFLTVKQAISWIGRAARWFAVPLAVAPLFFLSLGSTPLWQDEAQTALLARQIRQHGVPLVGTGHQSASALAGRDIGAQGLFVHIPPMQAYLTAAAFEVFGETSWSARLPFALAGWTCVLCVPWAMRRASNTEKAVAQLVLGTHVPFLLYSRQCRYYSVAALGILLACGAAHAVAQAHRDGMRPRTADLMIAWAGLTITALSFEFSFLAAVTAVVSALVVGVAVNPRLVIADLRRLLAVLGPPVVLFLGWLALARTAPSRRLGQGFNDSAPDVPWFFLGQLNAYGIPLLLLAGLQAATLVRGLLRRSRLDGVGEAAAFMALTCLVMAVHTTAATYTTHRFFRYVVPLVPVAVAAAVVAVQWVGRVWSPRRPWLVTVPLWLMLVTGLWAPRRSSDGEALWPWDAALERVTAVRWSRRNDVHLGSFLAELASPPRGPVAAVIDYLNRHAKPGDVVVAEYGEKPLKFHTQCRIYGGETAQLPTRAPQWLWRRHFPSLWWEVKQTRQWVEAQLRSGRWQKIILHGTADSLWENRPDPEVHIFSNRARSGPPVVLWRRVAETRRGTPQRKRPR